MTSLRGVAVIISCEHGGNRVPASFRRWFVGYEALLASHRGWDAGALDVARALARALEAPLISSTVSRLVVELNRSPGHPKLFSEPMRKAPARVRERARIEHYEAHRAAVERVARETIAAGQRVLHVASHSFTPVLDGIARRADIGLLHDPARRFESQACREWQRRLAAALPGYSVRRNYPYRGTSDGLTTWLRTRFAERDYAGIELEVNQKHVATAAWRSLKRALGETLEDLVRSLESATETGVRRERRRARVRRGDNRAMA